MWRRGRTRQPWGASSSALGPGAYTPSRRPPSRTSWTSCKPTANTTVRPLETCVLQNEAKTTEIKLGENRNIPQTHQKQNRQAPGNYRGVPLNPNMDNPNSPDSKDFHSVSLFQIKREVTCVFSFILQRTIEMNAGEIGGGDKFREKQKQPNFIILNGKWQQPKSCLHVWNVQFCKVFLHKLFALQWTTICKKLVVLLKRKSLSHAISFLPRMKRVSWKETFHTKLRWEKNSNQFKNDKTITKPRKRIGYLQFFPWLHGKSLLKAKLLFGKTILASKYDAEYPVTMVRKSRYHGGHSGEYRSSLSRQQHDQQ